MDGTKYSTGEPTSPNLIQFVAEFVIKAFDYSKNPPREKNIIDKPPDRKESTK